jgi:hypothetical protein
VIILHIRGRGNGGKATPIFCRDLQISATGLWQIFQEALNDSKRAGGSIRSAMSGEMFTLSSIAAS